VAHTFLQAEKKGVGHLVELVAGMWKYLVRHSSDKGAWQAHSADTRGSRGLHFATFYHSTSGRDMLQEALRSIASVAKLLNLGPRGYKEAGLRFALNGLGMQDTQDIGVLQQVPLPRAAVRG